MLSQLYTAKVTGVQKLVNSLITFHVDSSTGLIKTYVTFLEPSSSYFLGTRILTYLPPFPLLCAPPPPFPRGAALFSPLIPFLLSYPGSHGPGVMKWRRRLRIRNASLTIFRHDEEWNAQPNTTGGDSVFGAINEFRKKATANMVNIGVDSTPKGE